MVDSSHHSSRSIRLTCLQGVLGPVSTAQVRQVTTIGLLPTKSKPWYRVVVGKQDSGREEIK